MRQNDGYLSRKKKGGGRGNMRTVELVLSATRPSPPKEGNGLEE